MKMVMGLCQWAEVVSPNKKSKHLVRGNLPFISSGHLIHWGDSDGRSGKFFTRKVVRGKFQLEGRDPCTQVLRAVWRFLIGCSTANLLLKRAILNDPRVGESENN